ncbi:Protein lysB [Burkholderia lata]|uniref:Rz-like lysis system protein LysB n=1 Tax=Burkholderia lata (strain ATCC 17760 / DSM 23089 / LMG 22485 / NCIMB 9086 / R18194 / 383) TaxID=482957 RepID=UPI0014541715|nr:Rz-like lysis system protein LysB [Burkholderia lata]VWC91326.1 Protein lysB [Burkholderia lata]
MNPLVVRLLAVAVAALAAWSAVRYVKDLRGDLRAAQDDASKARETVTARDNTIAALLATAQENAKLQQRLGVTQSKIDNAQKRIEDATRRIINETPESRAWADTVLPAGIARLHASPAITGACDYVQHVPDGDTLHDVCNGARNER